MIPTLKITRLSGFGRGKSETPSGSSIVLGTEADAAVRFDATWDKSVSARHAKLVWEADAWWVVDSSREGTYLAGQKVARQKLSPGAVLELGKGGPTVRLDWEPPAAANLPPARAEAAPARPAEPPVARVAGPQYAPTTAAETESPRKGGYPIWTYAVAAAVIIGIAAAAYFLRSAGGPADQALAAEADQNAQAVALVVAVHPQRNGGQPGGIATAWAVEERLFATNAHVTEAVRKIMNSGGACYLVINRNPEKRLRVVRVTTHPRFGENPIGFEGKPMAVPGHDVGLIETAEAGPRKFRIARRAELEKIDSGYRLAYLGFPMEGMAGGGVDVRSPVATMQSGIVTAVTDFWLGRADFAQRLLVQHNLGASGGSSGSPLFNADGEVVAILSAGNVSGLSFIDGQAARAPSAVMVNFAQRVDLLQDIWPGFPK